MKMNYFTETDTLYLELKASDVAEIRDLDDSTLIDLDAAGNIVAITLEHASTRTDIHHLSLSGLPEIAA